MGKRPDQNLHSHKSTHPHYIISTINVTCVNHSSLSRVSTALRNRNYEIQDSSFRPRPLLPRNRRSISRYLHRQRCYVSPHHSLFATHLITNPTQCSIHPHHPLHSRQAAQHPKQPRSRTPLSSHHQHQPLIPPHHTRLLAQRPKLWLLSLWLVLAQVQSVLGRVQVRQRRGILVLDCYGLGHWGVYVLQRGCGV